MSLLKIICWVILYAFRLFRRLYLYKSGHITTHALPNKSNMCVIIALKVNNNIFDTVLFFLWGQS